MHDRELIRGIGDLTRLIHPSERVVTLFSGGLDSSYLLYLLAEHGFRDVVAVAFDLGDDLDRERLRVIAERLHARVEFLDCRDEFVEGFVCPAIQAQAVYLGLHPVSASLSRPLMARETVQLAHRIDASAILHTANRSQNTLRRLNGSLRLLEYEGLYGSPYELSAVARRTKQDALVAAGLPHLSKRQYSADSNLWCREFESGLLEDPEWFEVPPELYKWSVAEQSAPPCQVSVTFADGRPVMLNATAASPRAIIEELNRLAGRYGRGRYVGLEHLATGEKVLEVREMPAAEVLLLAYRQLESATLDAETIREKLHAEQVWVREAVEGRWFGQLRKAVAAFVEETAKLVTGTVTIRLSSAGAEVISVRAQRPLYIRHREEWEAGAEHPNVAATEPGV